MPLGSAHLPQEHIGGRSTHVSVAAGAAPFVEEALRWLPHDAATGDGEALLKPGNCCRFPVPQAMWTQACPGCSLRTTTPACVNTSRTSWDLLAERYDVQTVPDGQATLAEARERRPDLILSDVMMPRLDGIGLLRELRADADLGTIPVIFLSARAGEEARIEGLREGADSHAGRSRADAPRLWLHGHIQNGRDKRRWGGFAGLRSDRA